MRVNLCACIYVILNSFVGFLPFLQCLMPVIHFISPVYELPTFLLEQIIYLQIFICLLSFIAHVTLGTDEQ